MRGWERRDYRRVSVFENGSWGEIAVACVFLVLAAAAFVSVVAAFLY
jgi:hypothetical protein